MLVVSMLYCDVVADVEIEPAVAVVVDERRRHAPSRIADAASCDTSVKVPSQLLRYNWFRRSS